MQTIEKAEENQQEPEVIDEATLVAIDKAERWTPGTPGITFDEALKRARKRHNAWQNVDLELSA